MSSYAANITYSDAYWTKRRYELLATIEQRGLPTFFFKFSYAKMLIFTGLIYTDLCLKLNLLHNLLALSVIKMH